MKQEKISIIGVGSVGRALARIFLESGHEVLSLIDPKIEQIQSDMQFPNSVILSTDINGLSPKTTILFVCVSDDQIRSVVNDLADNISLKPGTVAAHTSGLLSSDVFSDLTSKDFKHCSVHPCYSFTKAFTDNLKGVYFAVEGDREGCEQLSALVTSIGGIPFPLSKEEKILYHTGCSLASNGLVSLMNAVQQVMGYADDPEKMKRIWLLVRSTLQNMEGSSVGDALTGPIRRGDIYTVESHLKSLQENLPAMLPMYITLGKNMLKLAEQSGLERTKIDSIKNLFDKYK